MHIPDGFLTPPVWGTLDAISAPAVAWVARRAQRETQDRRIPLLGVMGAFVFAAQMINFPVGPGTSGHLVGGALLSIVLGPAAAALVMTAILALQALIFQDGGVLALGANIFNMALMGVAAGFLPYRLWSSTNRSAAIFAAGAFSVMTSACLALGQLLISGVPMGGKVLWASLALFLVSALMEGAITIAAVRAIERLNPEWAAGAPQPSSSRALAGLALAVLALVVVGTLIASSAPDGIQRLIGQDTPAGPVWSLKVIDGIGGLILIFVLCFLGGKAISRRRSA
ncbi:MAG TPA: energy-coupling factor ABC transporter permease [Bryobacteraceae bacterium]|jgi:cobalt/nickel transport system permease protein